MRVWIVDRWLHIRASYWFIPLLMVTGAIAAAFGMVQLDMYVGAEWLREARWLYLNQPDGARALLSTVAGSMITVAGVTFSMTLLAVSHASSQIGPRLLSRFMRDRGNQYTLGTFIATFMYGLIVLRTVHSGEGDEGVFVPHLAILLALVLAVASVIVLIYFIHHVPQTISVSKVVSQVGDELVDSIGHLFPKRVGKATSGSSAGSKPDDFDAGATIMRMSSDGGYLRVLDGSGLMRLATENDLVVELLQRPGDFAIAGQPIMKVWPARKLNEDLEKELLRVFSWGSERTREQDVLFPVEQLLEVLGKAMSPGVNGQFTAILCINQFERALAAALRRDAPDECRFDDDGHLRVIAPAVTHRLLIDAIFQPLRQFIRGDWIATEHLLKTLRRLRAIPDLEPSLSELNSLSTQLVTDIRSSTIPSADQRLLMDLTVDGHGPAHARQD